MEHAESSTESLFELSANETYSWAKSGEPFGPQTLRSRIEPWLTALVQSEHLSLLIGSGLTHAVHGIAKGKELPGMQSIQFGIFGDEISAEAERVAEAAHRESGNFEDQVRVANELIRGLEIIASKKSDDAPEHTQISSLREGLTKALGSFTASILEGERNIALVACRKA